MNTAHIDGQSQMLPSTNSNFDSDTQPLFDQIWTRLVTHLGAHDRDAFGRRLREQLPRLLGLLKRLYGHRSDFLTHFENILSTAATMYAARPTDLKQLDERREQEPQWFQDQHMMGAVCYVDRFAEKGTLASMQHHLDYLDELGVTYLHLMPLFKCPPVRNDGGYAVSSFREIRSDIGTMQELADFARVLRERGISLVLDFVFNHTADDHEWAQRALAGDPKYQAFYYLFDDRTLPDLYERHLRPIFPVQRPGSFTYRPEINKWVWTTFFDFQWDLNYANPEVFRAMLEEMLFLANQGVEILRLDAVPFIWKQLGTTCENLPEAHFIIQAFNALVQVAAPSLLFKSEAIVHPRDVQSYIGKQECQLSYNPILMVSLWDALATQDVRLLRHSMQKRFALPEGCAWVNYLRSHDDIGWGFADEDADEVGLNAEDHRWFLSLYYMGRIPRSLAIGEPFQLQVDPRTRKVDVRNSGTLASLIGLEKALAAADVLAIDQAVDRIILSQAVVLSAGGIPLLYLGDEIGTLNDYSYHSSPEHAHDSRWLHRPRFDWIRSERRHDRSTIEGRIFHRLQRLIQIRKLLPAFHNGATLWFDAGETHIVAYSRHDTLLVVANFADQPQSLNTRDFARHISPDGSWYDLIESRRIEGGMVTLGPFQIAWLFPSKEMTTSVLEALQNIDAGMQSP